MGRRAFLRTLSAAVLLTAAAGPLGDGAGFPAASLPGTTGDRMSAVPARTAGGGVTPADAAEVRMQGCVEGTPVGRRIEGDVDRSSSSLRQQAERLSVSHDPEHLLTLAILRSQEDMEGSLELLTRALRYAPDDPLVTLSFVEFCRATSQAAACAGRDLERQLIRAAGENGAIWARIAARRHAAGDGEGALEALRRASTAPLYDDYWIDHVMLFERSLAASTDYAYAERVIAAIGLTAALDSIYRELNLVRVCREMEAELPEWRRECAAFGRRQELDSRTLLGTAAGLELQIAAYGAAKDEQRLAAATRRREALRGVFGNAGGRETLLRSDANALRQYLTEFAAHGERAALQFIDTAAARRESLQGCGA